MGEGKLWERMRWGVELFWKRKWRWLARRGTGGVSLFINKNQTAKK
jgi:hypothetical protein